MLIINHGHSCFEIREKDTSIIFDPYRDDSVPGLKLPHNLKANYVFSSHDHFDHNALEKVTIVPTKEELKYQRVVLPHDEFNGAKRGLSLATIVYFPNISICHMGDIGDMNAVTKHEELRNIDVVFCPINGFYTIGAGAAVKLQKEMNWKVLIPMHYEIKELGIGYPDGGQIDKFLKQIDNYLKVKTNQVEIDDNIINKYAQIIF